MKMKVLTTTFVVALIFSASVTALKVRRVEAKAAKTITEEKAEAKSDTNINNSETSDITKKEDKEVHKRGVFYHGIGGGLSSHSALSAYWPRSYASHYGYNLHLPGAATYSAGALAAEPAWPVSHAATPLLKYPVGTHFKTGYTALSAAPSLHSSALYPHAHAHAHFAASPAVATYAAAAPTLPVSAFATAPVAPAFAAAPAPAFAAAHVPAYAAAPAPAYAAAHVPAYAAAPAPAFAAAHFPAFAAAPAPPSVVSAHVPEPAVFHSHLPAPAVIHAGVAAPAVIPAPAPVQSPYVLRSGGAVVSSYSVNYPHHHFQKPAIAVQPVAQVPAIAAAPVQPIQPVVQAYRPVQAVQPVQPIHQHFVHSTFVQQPVPAIPAQPAFAVIPSLPPVPAAPAIPVAPVIPPSPPALPPTLRPFINIPVQPAAIPQFPVNPLPGPPPAPEGGSAVASPQIPPPIAQEPELPAPQPTQTPWRPVVDRPSITLMPPYGAPGEAYLPPAAPLQQQQLSSSLFDNLTEAEIQHIFAQATHQQQQQQHENEHQHQHHYHHHHRSAPYHHYK